MIFVFLLIGCCDKKHSIAQDRLPASVTSPIEALSVIVLFYCLAEVQPSCASHEVNLFLSLQLRF